MTAYPSASVNEAVRPSPSSLALPEHAWGRPKVGTSPAALSKAIAIIVLCYGIVLILAGIKPIPDASTMGRWTALPLGITTLVLFLGLWRGKNSVVRRSIALLIILHGVGLIGYLVLGSHDAFSWLRLGDAVVCIALGFGVLGAQQWARRGAVVWSLGLCGYLLFTMASTLSRMSSREPLFTLIAGMSTMLIVSPFLGLTLYGVLPSTKKHFAEALASSRGAGEGPGSPIP